MKGGKKQRQFPPGRKTQEGRRGKELDQTL